MTDGISAYIGGNGEGKSLSAVKWEVLPWLAKGRPVLSNTPIFASADDADLPWQERKVHPLFIPLVSWRQLSFPLDRVLIFLDEISSMFDSRESARMPAQISTRFQQLRKGDNAVVWTAPDWDACDKRLRRVTRSVTFCRGSWSVPVEGREWRSNRKIRNSRYDVRRYEEFSLTQAQSTRTGTIKPDFKRSYWRTRDQAQFFYDTLAPVELLDHLDEGGRCVDCGGRRPTLKCECGTRSTSRRQPEPMTIAEMKSYALSLAPDLRQNGVDMSYLELRPDPPILEVAPV